MFPWHVLRVRSPFEAWVCGSSILPLPTGLAALGVTGFSPMYQHEVTKIIKPLLPGYVFARFDTYSADTWHKLKNTPHVLGFISEDASVWPAPVLDPVVDYWYDNADADGVVPLEARRVDVLRGFGAGDTLTITEGALAGQSGLCLWVDQRGARIEVALLGRTMGLYVGLASVKRTSEYSGAGSKALELDSDGAWSRSKYRRERRRRASVAKHLIA